MYADDLTLIVPGVNKIKVTQTANKVLDSVNTWLTFHKLTLNISKTKYKFFSSQLHNIRENWNANKD